MAFHTNRCPECGNEIGLPAILKQGNIKMQGAVKITCNYFNPRKRKQCKGFIEIKPKQEVVETINLEQL